MKTILIDSEDMKNVLVTAFKDRLTNEYSSPARAVIDKVMAEVAPEFEVVIKEVLETIAKDKDFKDALHHEFKHKVAKMLVGDLTGSVEKAVNVFRQDQTLKAKMILAVEKMIEESSQPDES